KGLPTVKVSEMTGAPGGRVLALLGEDKRIRIWDSQAERIVAEWTGTPPVARSIVFTPDGRSLAWIDEKQQIHLRSPGATKDSRILKVSTTDRESDKCIALGLAFSPDGKYLLASCMIVGRLQAGGPLLLDLKTGKRIRHYGLNAHWDPTEGSLRCCFDA